MEEAIPEEEETMEDDRRGYSKTKMKEDLNGSVLMNLEAKGKRHVTQ